MKKYVYILTILTLIMSTFDLSAKKVTNKESGQEAPQVELKTKIDTASYAFGICVGSQMKTYVEQMEFDKGLFAKALCDYIFGNPTAMTLDSAKKFAFDYEKEVREQAVKTSKEQESQFLEANKKREGVKVTPSGLQYQVVKMGDGAKPTAANTVRVHYEGFLTDGTKFDSSVDRGKPAEFPLNGVIKGWTEGLQLMPVGSKFTFYIPSELGYGANGAGNAVPPYATLIFEVELLDIVK